MTPVAGGTFAAQYPLSMALNIRVIDAGPGFDVLDLEARLGTERFKQLMSSLKQVFCTNHRKYPDDHPLAGYEVHCVYLSEVEKFLHEEGN